MPTRDRNFDTSTMQIPATIKLATGIRISSNGTIDLEIIGFLLCQRKGALGRRSDLGYSDSVISINDNHLASGKRPAIY